MHPKIGSAFFASSYAPETVKYSLVPLAAAPCKKMHNFTCLKTLKSSSAPWGMNRTAVSSDL